ncbi:acyltransferase family protein [Paenibacillus sp. 598K]|uniref:acyltransferase family protein n=1 Tax=Paenibacillus sp. 598K TaxID=1117987 RepID=UPI000FFF52F5|nr:acyltransferase [Paenibacillus sp. 598K]
MKKHLSLIHVSRAIVPLLVILLHTSNFSSKYFDYNFLGMNSLPYSGGVDFFFVLSGFMIFYLFHKHIGNRSKLKSFLIGRFIRIYPFYWVILTLIVPVYFFVPDFGQGWETDSLVIVKSYLLIHQPHSPVLGVAWSLCHTVLFYFIFSFLFFSPRLSGVIVSIWLIVVVANALFLIPHDSIWIDYLFSYTLIKFVLGCFLAFIVLNYRIQYGKTMVIIGIIGFPLTWINHVNGFIDTHVSLGYTLFSCLVILGLSSIDMKREIKIPKLLNYLGLASYSLYLINQPAISVLSKLFHKLELHLHIGPLASSIIMMLLAIIIGCMAFSFVERPLIQFIKRLGSKRSEKSPTSDSIATTT